MGNSIETRCGHTAGLGLSLLKVGLLLLGAALLLSIGCGRQAAQKPAEGAVDMEGVTLPTWAPDKPSPELIRAARVLKPLPEQVLPYSPLALASYELFGALTDEQIATFGERKQQRQPLSNVSQDVQDLFTERYGGRAVGDEYVYDFHEVTIPFPSLTPAQREAFDKVVEAWRETFAGRPERADLLVSLYEIGAEEDLANLEVVFRAKGHSVGLTFMIRTPDGANVLGANDFAQL